METPENNLAETLGKINALTRALLVETGNLTQGLIALGYAPPMKTAIDASMLEGAGIIVTHASEPCVGPSCPEDWTPQATGAAAESGLPVTDYVEYPGGVEQVSTIQAPLPAWNADTASIFNWHVEEVGSIEEIPTVLTLRNHNTLYKVLSNNLLYYPDLEENRWRPILPPNAVETFDQLKGDWPTIENGGRVLVADTNTYAIYHVDQGDGIWAPEGTKFPDAIAAQMSDVDTSPEEEEGELPPPTPVVSEAGLLIEQIRYMLLRYLAPDMYAHATGTLRPGVGTGNPLQQYSEDIIALPWMRTHAYPSGFYRGKDNGALQLHIKDDSYRFFVPNTFAKEFDPKVVFSLGDKVWPIEQDGLRSLSHSTLTELKFLFRSLQAKFQAWNAA